MNSPTGGEIVSEVSRIKRMQAGVFGKAVVVVLASDYDRDVQALNEKLAANEKALSLVQSHAKTAWARGHRTGLAGNEKSVREAVAAMNAARQETLDENAQFTELLEQVEAQRDQLAAENKRLREALIAAGKGVHWLQVHAPLNEKARWRAYEIRGDIEDALSIGKEVD